MIVFMLMFCALCTLLSSFWRASCTTGSGLCLAVIYCTILHIKQSSSVFDMCVLFPNRWLMPFIGHMGIATSAGVIRDFAGPYYVSEDEMAFGRPTKYWQLDPNKITKKGQNVRDTWDLAVYDASEEYKTRMHNLCCDNCHSHVAMALNMMGYGGSKSWNMVKLCFLMLIFGKYVSICGFIKTWLPFLIMAGGLIVLAAVFA